MPLPLVSIVLPSKNGGRFLDEAVQSIVNQSWNEWELTLVNDGSTDRTPQLMNGWAAREARIRVVHLAQNLGLPRALNTGFAKAEGEFFTWTSDDNRYRPQALERLAEHLQTRTDVDLVYSDWTKIDDRSRELEAVRVLPPTELPSTNCVGASFLFRRAVFETLGGYDPDLFLAEDYDFWLRASVRFKLAALHEDLYEYRLHDQALTIQRKREIRQMALRALLRWIVAAPRPSREARMKALVHCSDLAWNNGRPLEARQLLWRAMWEGRAPFFYAGGRLHLAEALLGMFAGKSLRRLGRLAGWKV